MIPKKPLVTTRIFEGFRSTVFDCFLAKSLPHMVRPMFPLFWLTAALTILSACQSTSNNVAPAMPSHKTGNEKMNEITSHQINVNGHALAYLKAGNGPAVVIVHGVGGHKEDWREVMSELAKTHTVFAIDMLGFGASSRDAPDLSMNAQAAAISTLLATQTIPRASVIGNSVGGWVAATFAANYPRSLDKLVLIDPAGFRAMFDGEPPVKLFPSTVDETQKLLRYVLHSDFAHTREFAEKAFADIQAKNEKTIEMRLNKGLFESTRLEDLGAKIKVPTLVVWGSEDRLFPPQIADVVVTSIAGAQKVLVPKAGHFPQVDNPKGVIDPISEFLRR
jgi:pimeloyl-ACP methyl ester carboxylesterase